MPRSIYTYHSFQTIIFMNFAFWDLKNMLAMEDRNLRRSGCMRFAFSQRVCILNFHKNPMTKVLYFSATNQIHCVNIDYSIGTYEYNMLQKIFVCTKRFH
jgi:hypothetical protein